jgi:hypothetical protein
MPKKTGGNRVFMRSACKGAALETEAIHPAEVDLAGRVGETKEKELHIFAGYDDLRMLSHGAKESPRRHRYSYPRDRL